jgi:hypothetical protein
MSNKKDKCIYHAVSSITPSMPTLPIRQQLLRGAFKYARQLQQLRRCATDDLNSESDGGSDMEAPRSQRSQSSNDLNDDDSLPSSISSISSLSSGLDDDMAAGHNGDSDDDLSTDTEDDRLYIKRLAALQERINFLTNTCVLFPNRVHKLSQLYLVLVLYKEDDHK